MQVDNLVTCLSAFSIIISLEKGSGIPTKSLQQLKKKIRDRKKKFLEENKYKNCERNVIPWTE